MERMKEQTAAMTGGKSVRKVLGFAALIIATFMGVIDGTIVNIALPDITTYFHVTLSDTAWITTIYIMALAVFMITASKLADQFGRKKVMLIGLVLFGVSSALCGFSNSLMALIVLRLFQGLGGAIITPVVMPMVIELFGKSKMASVASVIGAITGLAAAGGPPLGGVLIQYGSWRTIFFVNVPFAVLAFVLIAFCTDESYDRTVSKRVDVWGILLLSASIFLLSFALLKGNDYRWKSALIVGMFIGAAVTGALFLLVERKSKAPMVELGLFREMTFTMSSVCYMLTGFGLVGSAVIFNYFLQSVRQYQALDAAFIVMFASLMVIVAMPLGSLIANKWSAKPVNFLGVLLMGVGCFLLSRVDAHTTKQIMILDMIVNGVGMGFACQTLVSSLKHLPHEKSGIGSGVVNAARQIGTCIGIALLVSVLDTNVANMKTDLRTDALQDIDRTSISDSVKTIAKQDMQAIFQTDDTDKQKTLRTKLENDVKQAMQTQAMHPDAALLRQAKTPLEAQALVKAQMLKQANELSQVMTKINNDKETKLVSAFSNVLGIAAIILIVASVCGLFTDKKKARPV